VEEHNTSLINTHPSLFIIESALFSCVDRARFFFFVVAFAHVDQALFS
jgi:uncharacterized protein Veg